MTSKQFVFRSICIVVFFIFFFITTNLIVNDFGLWKNRESIRIWTREKTSKYLLSHRYIPDNYDGLIIGSSVAANINPLKLDHGKIYNLSMEGANSFEAQMCTQKVINRGNISLIIVSMYPYFTQDCGIKGAQIAPQEYWGSVFSVLPIRVTFCKARKALFKDFKSRYNNSEHGYIDINVGVDTQTFYKEMKEFKEITAAEITLNENALKSLKEILHQANLNNIKVVAYYHPIFIKKFNGLKKSGAWKEYQSKLATFTQKVDFVWDLNTPEYNYLRSDIINYTGTGHLSSKGVKLLEESIRDSLQKHL